MIRFACPGCEAVYTVEASQSGKTGHCPKCELQFVIPFPYAAGSDSESMAAASGPNAIGEPGPTPSRQPVEIAPCPHCATRMTVWPEHLGEEVECPACATPFCSMARANRVAVPPRKAMASNSSRRFENDDDDDDDRKSARRRRWDDEDEDDDRPRRRSHYNEEAEGRPRRTSRRNREPSKRVTAAILALLLGSFGIHKFYLGYPTAGLLMLVLSCFGVSWAIALAEGIIYLTKTDDEFIELYQVGTKEWF